MRAIPSLVSSLTAATLSLAAAPAPAQEVAAVNHVASTVAAPGADEIVAVRTVGTFRFLSPRDVRVPAEVVVADSAGDLRASFRYTANGAAHPLVVHLMDTDLVLQGETTEGVLTLVLYGQNGAIARSGAVRRSVAGRWSLGHLEGELRTRGRR